MSSRPHADVVPDDLPLSILLVVSEEAAARSAAGHSALHDVRTEIDRIDHNVVTGIAEREIWVRTAAKLKAMAPDAGDAERADRVIKRVRTIAVELQADADVVERTYRAMIAAFIDLEFEQQGSVGDPATSSLPEDAGVAPRTGLISPLLLADAGEVLTLQRAAYVAEARLYGDPELPPLVQTLPELIDELAKSQGYKAVHGSRIVGTVRAQVDGDILRIGRLAVAPDVQHMGLGTALLAAAESGAGPGVSAAAVFTGHLSTDNLRLYARHGYVEEGREVLNPGLTLIHLRKALG